MPEVVQRHEYLQIPQCYWNQICVQYINTYYHTTRNEVSNFIGVSALQNWTQIAWEYCIICNVLFSRFPISKLCTSLPVYFASKVPIMAISFGHDICKIVKQNDTFSSRRSEQSLSYFDSSTCLCLATAGAIILHSLPLKGKSRVLNLGYNEWNRHTFTLGQIMCLSGGKNRCVTATVYFI